jgi:hypothetical protein
MARGTPASEDEVEERVKTFVGGAKAADATLFRNTIFENESRVLFASRGLFSEAASVINALIFARLSHCVSAF